MSSAVASTPVTAASIDAPNTLYNINSPAALPITNNTPAAAPDANEALVRALYKANQWYPTPPNSSRVPTPSGPQQMAAYPLVPPYAHIPAYAPVPYHAQIPTYGPHPAYVHHPAYAPMLPYALVPAYAPYLMQAPAPQGPMQVHNAPSAQAYYAASSASMSGTAAPTNIASLSNGATAGPTSGAAALPSGVAPTNDMPSRHYRPHVYEAARAERAAQAAQSLEAPQPVQAEVFQIAQSTQGVQTAPAAQGVQTAPAAQVSQAAQSAETSQIAHAAQDSNPAHSAQDSQPAQAARVLSVQVAQNTQPSPQVLHAGLPALKRKRDESKAEQDDARHGAGRQSERDIGQSSERKQSKLCRWKHAREACTYDFYPHDYPTLKECMPYVKAHLSGVVVKQGEGYSCQWGLCARAFAEFDKLAGHVARIHVLGNPNKKAKTSH